MLAPRSDLGTLNGAHPGGKRRSRGNLFCRLERPPGWVLGPYRRLGDTCPVRTSPTTSPVIWDWQSTIFWHLPFAYQQNTTAPNSCNDRIVTERPRVSSSRSKNPANHSHDSGNGRAREACLRHNADNVEACRVARCPTARIAQLSRCLAPDPRARHDQIPAEQVMQPAGPHGRARL